MAGHATTPVPLRNRASYEVGATVGRATQHGLTPMQWHRELVARWAGLCRSPHAPDGPRNPCRQKVDAAATVLVVYATRMEVTEVHIVATRGVGLFGR